MATIAQIVAQIRTAIFGRDVRENIAQGIEKCYDDVTTGATVADAAAENANTKAGLANDAAALANTKAGLADAAATAANTAAAAAENVNASVSKSGNTVTFSVTNRNGVTSSEDLSMEGSIDDTKGIGDTDYVWSADKNVKELLKVDGDKVSNEAVYTEKTASGSIVEIEEAVAEAVKQMRIEIAPLQDLHGYDSPFIDGSGINLYTLPTLSSTSGNVTLTPNNDGTITLSGTASSTASMFYCQLPFTIPANTKVNISLNNSETNSEVGVRLISGLTQTSYGTPVYADETNKKSTVTQTWDTTYINVFVKTNHGAVSSITLNLMVEIKENICPISGHDKAEVVRTGKNLFDVSTILQGKVINASGEIVNSSYSYLSDYIKVNESTGYIVSGTDIHKAGATTGIGVYVNFFDSFKTWKSRTGNDSGDYSFTTPSDCAYIRFSYGYSGTSVQLEKGLSATTYEAYHGSTYSISFPSAAGTVYGGNLTVNADGTGTLVVDRAESDIGSLSWEYNSTYSVFQVVVSGKTGTSGDESGIISSCYRSRPYGNNASFDTEDGIIYMHTNGSIRIRDSRYTDANTFKTALTGQTLVYPIATASSYTLTTDQVVHLLNGHNTVYADCGYATVLYSSDKYLTSEQAEKERIHESITTSAPIQTFHDGADNVPMGLKVAVEPVQNLNGYGYPWVGGSGKNLLNHSGVTNTINTVVFTMNDDGTVNVNGTNSGSLISYIYASSTILSDIPAGNYYYTSGLEIAGSNTTWDAGVWDNTTSNYAKKWDGTNFSVLSYNSSFNECKIEEGHNYSFILHVRESAAPSNVIFKPMLCKSTETDTTFEPYSNICPISGHDKAEVTRTGKNLLNLALFNQHSSYPNIVFERVYQGDDIVGMKISGTQSTTVYCITPLFIMKAGSYIISSGITETIGACDSLIQLADGTTIARGNSTTPGQSFTLESDTKIRVLLRIGDNYSIPSAGVVFKPMIRLASETDDTFEPFGDIYTIPFSTTMYGGYLTVGKDGEVTATVEKACVDLGSLSWTLSNGYFATSGINSTVKRENTATAVPDAICSAYRVSYWNDSSDHTLVIAWANISTSARFLWIKDTSKSTVDEFVSSVKGQTLVYPLATPVTVRLNFTTIRSLLGTNNVWADTGDIKEIHWSADVKSYIDNQNADGMIAQTEASMTATRAYADGELFTVKRKLYKATSAIAIGDALVVGTNCTETTVTDECINNGSAGMIAQTEDSMIATKDYAEGELFAVYITLYKATSAIAIGDALVVGTNCIETTVANEISAILNSTATGVSF